MPRFSSALLPLLLLVCGCEKEHAAPEKRADVRPSSPSADGKEGAPDVDAGKPLPGAAKGTGDAAKPKEGAKPDERDAKNSSVPVEPEFLDPAKTGIGGKYGKDGDIGWSLTVEHAAFSPDAKRVVLAYSADAVGKYLILWDVDEARKICVLPGHKNKVRFCSFLADGDHIVSATSLDGWVIVHRVKDGVPEVAQRFQAHAGGLWNAALAGNGKYLATAGLEEEDEIVLHPFRKLVVAVKVWDLDKGVLVKQLKETVFSAARHVDLAISPDGNHLVLGSTLLDEGRRWLGETKLWKVANGHVIQEFSTRDGWCCPIGFTADGKRLALQRASPEKPRVRDLCLWDIAKGKETATIRHAIDSSGWFSFQEPLGDDVFAAIIPKDWARQARFWSWDKGSKLNDVILDHERLSLRKDKLESSASAISRNGRFALLASGMNQSTIEGSRLIVPINIHIWDLVSGKLHKQWTDKTRPLAEPWF